MDLAGDAVPYYKDYQVMLSYDECSLNHDIQNNAIRGAIASSCFLIMFAVIGIVNKFRWES